MSGIINAKKSSFVVFGSGFELNRDNSGEGQREPDIRPFRNATTGAINETGQFVWLSDRYNYINKISIKDWTIESHNVHVGSIHHPCNVANNIGLSIHQDQTTVFNLTTGEVIKTLSGLYVGDIADCILIDDVIYLVEITNNRSTVGVYKIDLENETATQYSTIGQRTSCGFVDNDTMYMVYPAPWFSDYNAIYGYGLGGGTQWSRTASVAGGSGFAKVALHALCGNGHIYAFSNVNGGWKLGVYDGNSAPDFNTPSPIRTFGEFASKPNLEWATGRNNYVYNQGKTKSAFATNIGTFYTDFSKVVKLTSSPSLLKPLAMDDHTIVGQVNNTDIGVYYI